MDKLDVEYLPESTDWMLYDIHVDGVVDAAMPVVAESQTDAVVWYVANVQPPPRPGAHISAWSHSYKRPKTSRAKFAAAQEKAFARIAGTYSAGDLRRWRAYVCGLPVHRIAIAPTAAAAVEMIRWVMQLGERTPVTVVETATEAK